MTVLATTAFDEPEVPEDPGISPYSYAGLLAEARGLPNDRYLARIIASWLNGSSVLPAWLGLALKDYRALMARHFPRMGAPMPCPEPPGLSAALADEQRDVAELIRRHRRGADRSEVWLAQIVAAGCLGREHLWRDLGLSGRGELSELIASAFPDLRTRNDRDMKWKKFLYKCLCEETGIYTCRAPSCDACSDFHDCFGPEE